MRKEGLFLYSAPTVPEARGLVNNWNL